MLTADELVGIADSMNEQHGAERQDLDTLRLYATGRQRMPLVIPQDAPSEVRELARLSRINIIGIVVKALVESLYLDNIREVDTGSDEPVMPPGEDEPEDRMPDPGNETLTGLWRAWLANRMNRRQAGLYRAAFEYSFSYLSVTRGKPYPVMRPVSPRRMFALYAEDADWPSRTLERRRSGWRVQALGPNGAEVADLVRDERGRWQVRNQAELGLQYIPVVRYVPEEDLDADDEPISATFGQLYLNQVNITGGEVAPLMTMQDQADVDTFSLKSAQWYSAFRQRWIKGWTPETRNEKLKMGASQVWAFDDHPDDVAMGEFGQTDLQGFLASREDTLKYAATLSQTPVHELIGELVNLSAEALAAAEAGRDRKVMLNRTSFGESHEQMFQAVGDLMGLDVPEDLESVWRDTSARAFSATVDALGKAATMLQIPPEMLWDRIPGVTRQDVERWRAAAAEGDAIGKLSSILDKQASGADPATFAAGEQVRPSGLVVPAGSGA
jgi:hypothetical protein